MKRRLGIILMVCVAMAFASLANVSSTKAASVSLTVWMTGSDDDATAFKAASDLWAKSTGNTVTVQAVSWNDAYAKYLSAGTSGQGPDIITGGLSFGIDLGAKGAMVDLGKKYATDVAAMKAASNPGIWGSIQSPTGEVFGVPYNLDFAVTYYRPDLLTKAGVKAFPKTWDDLTTTVKALQKANNGKGGYQINWGNASWLGYSNYLWQAGGDFYSADCKKVIVNDAKGVAALKYFASLYTDLGAPSGSTDVPTGLATGDYPIALDGEWNLGSLDTAKPELKGKWAAAVQPAGPAGKSTSFIGGKIIGVMAYSKNVDAAFDLIKYTYTADASKAIIQATADKGSLFFPPQVAFEDYIKLPADSLAVIKAQLADAKGPSNCPGFEETNKELEKQIQSVILKGTDPQDALDAAADAMTKALK